MASKGWEILSQLRSPQKLFWVLFLIYMINFGLISIVYLHNFSDADGLNYVDVAQNILTGRGITQSVLGFNLPFFPINDSIPEPLIIHAPGYSLMIAFLGLLGTPLTNAALIISWLGYLLALLAGYLLTRSLRDEETAILAVVLLLLYYPLRTLGASALSDAPAFGLALLSLFTLHYARKARGSEWLFFAAGAIAGMAFAVRYGYLFLACMAILAIDRSSWQSTFRSASLYLVGLFVLVGLLWIRNLSISGTLMGHMASSSRNLLESFVSAFRTTFGQYLGPSVSVSIQLITAAVVVFVILVILFRRGSLGQTARDFVTGHRYILFFWLLGYLALFSYQRSVSYFDIDFRTVLPAGAMVVIVVSDLLIYATKLKVKTMSVLGAIVMIPIILQQFSLMITVPPYNVEKEIAASETLTWIQQHTTEHDLIFGDRALALPFYFNRQTAIWFVRKWNVDDQQLSNMLAFAHNQCGKYHNLYILMWPHADDNSPLIIQGAEFKKQLKDGYIYQIPCVGNLK